jgi:hypothetical protein
VQNRWNVDVPVLCPYVKIVDNKASRHFYSYVSDEAKELMTLCEQRFNGSKKRNAYEYVAGAEIQKSIPPSALPIQKQFRWAFKPDVMTEAASDSSRTISSSHPEGHGASSSVLAEPDTEDFTVVPSRMSSTE